MLFVFNRKKKKAGKKPCTKGANNIHFACTYVNSGKIYKKLIKPGDSTWVDGKT